jgi:hypothetical protein
VSEVKIKDFTYFRRVSKERFHLHSIRSHLGDKWQILKMFKSDNDAVRATSRGEAKMQGRRTECERAASSL